MKRFVMTWLLVPCLAGAQPAVQPPLSGPEVTESRIDGVESGFSSMMAPERMAEPVPMPVFRRAVAELIGDQAPGGARLSDEQRQKLRTIEREQTEAMVAFRRQHAEEFRQLREALGPQLAERLDLEPQREGQQRRGAGRAERPDRGRRAPADADQMGEMAGAMAGEMEAPPPPQRPLQRGDLTDAQRAAMMRLRELRSQAPGAEAIQTKVWAELTEPQRAHVQSRIDEHRAQQAERRQEAYVERMARQRAAAGEQPERPERPLQPGRPMAELSGELRETLESLPEPLRQRLAQAPPERQRQILQRLSRLTPEERAQALRRFQQGRARSEGRGDDGPDRGAPPPMERVNVPEPREDPEPDSQKK